ncbi:MAG: Flp pilus assembly protein CpaB [Telluria sp.]|nr:Flp pilus assembly protein CpaB [Telluria sp.]
MKNKRAILMMAVAVLLGIAAVALASRWLLNQSAGNVVRIVVAADDVNLGQRLVPQMLKLTEWPADKVPPGAFSDLAKLTDRVLKTSVLRGEPLAEGKLAPAGTMGGLSALITEGKRAITVRVNDVIGVAGFALPGNYVDIIVHAQKEPDPKETNLEADRHISKIVLERILVLAVAQEVSRDDTKPRVVNAVTLEVTPVQAESLDLARSVGTLSLALRNQVDAQSPATIGATKGGLFGVAAPAPPAPTPKPVAVATPVARPPAVHKVAQVKRECVSVISGLHTVQECF